MVIYVETGLGAGLRTGRSIDSARRAELKSVGTYNGVYVCREATLEDISNVAAMGGYVPALPKKYKVEEI